MYECAGMRSWWEGHRLAFGCFLWADVYLLVSDDLVGLWVLSGPDFDYIPTYRSLHVPMI